MWESIFTSEVEAASMEATHPIGVKAGNVDCEQTEL